MIVKALGDSAWLAEWKEPRPGPVLTAVRALEQARPAGLVDVVASFASLAVYYDALVADAEAVRDWMAEVLAGIPEDAMVPKGRKHTLSVKYDGEDLTTLAEKIGLTVDEVVELHSGSEYTVVAVGFLPGFPYLTGCPEMLRVPRRATPRLAVPAGSVAIAGGLTGIYPVASPGGWHLLGTTNTKLFEPEAEKPALLTAGDRVKFVAQDKLTKVVRKKQSVPTGRIEVLRAGGQTSVQDFGRTGYGGTGVSPGGVMDRVALRAANLLVGNAENAAALEICMSGPCLRFDVETVVALLGANAAGWQSGRRVHVKAGGVVDIGVLQGASRAVLAVAGGLRVPQVLGSSSTAVRAGFGGSLLKVGDRLDFFPTESLPKEGEWLCGIARPEPTPLLELRYLAGVQGRWFSKEAARRLAEENYRLTPDSDRMGARFSGPSLELERPREMISQPVCNGSIQVPPDGQPIILMAERQTIGGYPQIGHVITADLPKLARALPGTWVRFRDVTLEDAHAAILHQERELAWLRVGLDFHK